jgi:DNA-binding LytR/AlgR family response regulator
MLLEQYKQLRPGVEIETRTFLSGAELLESIKAGDSYNLLLLDILMPGLNGIELAREIQKINQDSVIIFLTNSKDHALEAYGVSAVQYIIKPIKSKNLFPIMDKIIPMFSIAKERYFLLSMQERDVRIPFSSIICIELYFRRLRCYLDNGAVLLGKYIRKSFSDAIEPLLRDERFISVHKSFVLNLEKVEELKKDSFLMKNNIFIPVSRLKYANVKKTYLAFVLKTGE